MAQKILRGSIARVAARQRDCGCLNALQFALITDPAAVPAQAKRDLAPIVGRYLR